MEVKKGKMNVVLHNPTDINIEHKFYVKEDESLDFICLKIEFKGGDIKIFINDETQANLFMVQLREAIDNPMRYD